MGQLWVPDLVRQRRELTPEPRDYRLSDGRVVMYRDDFRAPAGNGTVLHGLRYDGEAGLRVIASLDHADAHGLLLHVSLSYPDHLPDWETVYAVKLAWFGPEIDAAMMLPREADFVHGIAGGNPYVLHVWQLPVVWGIG